MLAMLADVCCRRHEEALALVACASNPLLRRLVHELVSASGSDGEHPLSLGLLGAVFLGLPLLGRLLLWVARALLATLVFALHARLV